MSNQSNDELDKEIEALEREIFGTPDEESIEDTGEVEASELVIESKTIDPQKIEDKPSDAEVKRFNNYKASTDITIRDLRNELAASKMKFANLQKGYSDLVQKVSILESKSNSKNLFSEEEIDILGEPAANALDKGVKDLLEAKVKPLEEELNRVRKESADREAREANELKKGDYNRFISQLAKVVPDYADINVSPGFLKYMKDADEYSGVPREYLFKKAEESLDVGRIASFFVDYKKSVAPIKSNEEILQEAITPTGSSGSKGSETNNDTKEPVIITGKFIDKFYDDFNRGKYKTKKGREEAAKIEALIDKAVLSGQVR